MRWQRVVLGLAWVLAASALANEKVVREPDRTVYRKKTVVDFTDMAVEGELTRPDGAYVLNRRQSSFPSRIRIRDNFTDELQRSADDL